MSCGMKHLKLSVAEKSNILWKKVKEKYIWGSSAMNTCILSQSGIEYMWWHYRILLRETGIAKQHARVKAIMQYCALECNSVRECSEHRSMPICCVANETLPFRGHVKQFEVFWKGADSAWRKCSWCGEEGERHTFLSFASSPRANLLSCLCRGLCPLGGQSMLKSMGSFLGSHMQHHLRQINFSRVILLHQILG